MIGNTALSEDDIANVLDSVTQECFELFGIDAAAPARWRIFRPSAATHECEWPAHSFRRSLCCHESRFEMVGMCSDHVGTLSLPPLLRLRGAHVLRDDKTAKSMWM